MESVPDTNLTDLQDERMTDVTVQLERLDIEWDLFTGDSGGTQLVLTWNATRRLASVLKTASRTSAEDIGKQFGLHKYVPPSQR